jgi:hypothetical protein
MLFELDNVVLKHKKNNHQLMSRQELNSPAPTPLPEGEIFSVVPQNYRLNMSSATSPKRCSMRLAYSS